MDGSSVVWENKDWIYGEKHKKNLFWNTLDKLSFDSEILALKLVDITTEMSRKN